MTTKGRRKKPSPAPATTGSGNSISHQPVPPRISEIDGRDALVVGIGASAGGLEALKAFFSAMPPATGMSFVVVVHLDPTHQSLMPELLSHVTTLKVEHARDRTPLEADHVYVIPPNRTLTVDQGLIRVQYAVDRRGLRGVIDHMFRSLAEAERDKAIAIVLSGTGSEGTLGAREIKAQGGLVIAQAPTTAAQAGMPSSVIATGIVDFVLPPDEMPELLLRYRASAAPTRAGADDVPGEAKSGNGLNPILAILRARAKFDFRGYRQGTIRRRVERRMGLHQIETTTAYAEFLRKHPAEVDQVFKDLLIGVTSFFRDAPAFEELGTSALAHLVKGRDVDTPVRVWVPGCATGEEAYSIAIVFAEQIAAEQSPCRVQIFATDVDEQALDAARGGSYSESIALDVTALRLQRFFTHENHRYTINKSIRDSITFARQNVITDPPFSRLDLVSCRNLLIYLEPSVQERLLALFHFALVPGGFLFLGSAESSGQTDESFAPVSSRHRIFRRLGFANRPAPKSPVAPAPVPGGVVHADAKATPEGTVQALADRALMQHISPAAVVVGHTGQIVHLYGPMERYIKLPSGEATLDLLTLAREPLRPTLRAALRAAVTRHRQTTFDVTVKRDKRHVAVRVIVRPLAAPRVAEGLWLMIFEEPPASRPDAAPRPARGQLTLVRRLETELRETKKEQERVVEELEGSHEELKAANEEVLSMNEELQSTNEELVTSKEELQSMNEELTTLNAQLQDRIDDSSRAREDLNNLIASSDIATVFLDTELRIKRFTPAATRILNVLPSDVARPITHIATTLVDLDLPSEAQAVLRSATPLDKEARSKDGQEYLVRVRPYLAEDDAVAGVALTLVNVTALKATERELRATRQQASADLLRMTRLHQLSTVLAGTDDLSVLLEEILRATMEITGAGMGAMHLHDGVDGLRRVAHYGCAQPLLDAIDHVRAETGSVSAVALKQQRRVVVEDVTTNPDVAGSPALDVLVAAGVRGTQSTPLLDRAGQLVGMMSTHYSTPHRFTEGELQWVDLLARDAADLIERRQIEQSLAAARTALEQRFADQTKWLQLMRDISHTINDSLTWEDALHRVLERLCETEHWQVGFVYLPQSETPDVLAPAIGWVRDTRLRHFYDVSAAQRIPRGETPPGRVYADGQPVWVDDQQTLRTLMPTRAEAIEQTPLRSAALLPITSGHDVIGVLELFSTERRPTGAQLTILMQDVSAQIARVLEWERSTAQMADLVWREQQGLLHTLHDSLGQTLTGLGMLSSGLRQQLAGTNQAAAETAQQVAQQAQLALEQVRQLGRGFPVDVEAKDLMPALRELASTTESFHKIPVRVDGNGRQSVRDNRVATQLYRIAQEAVTNAVKHAQPTSIGIAVAIASGLATMRIVDNGIGIQDTDGRDAGLGIRIMRYRATSIGAHLSIEHGPDSGTIVTCTMRDKPTSAIQFARPSKPGASHVLR